MLQSWMAKMQQLFAELQVHQIQILHGLSMVSFKWDSMDGFENEMIIIL